MSEQQEIESQLDQVEAELKHLALEAQPHLENIKRIYTRIADLQSERERLCLARLFAFMEFRQ